MNNNIYFGVVILLAVMLPCTASADEYSIFCGQTQNITCEYTGQNHSVISSAQSICRINRTLAGDEAYSFVEGPCDITFTCAAPSAEGAEGVVMFPMKVRLENTENSTRVNMTIRDWLGNDYSEREWIMNYGDTGFQEWGVEFTCPADISTEINVDTCAKYFDQILQKGDPLLFQLATGQTTCIEELVDCQAEVKAVNSQYSEYRVNYQQRVDERIDAEAELIDCRQELDPNHPNSTVRQYINQRDERVPALWMWLAIIFGTIICISGVLVIFKPFW